MSMEFEFSKDSNLAVSPHSITESPLQPGMLGGGGGGVGGGGTATGNTACPSGTGTVRKRVLKTADCANRSNLFFCGKRKRSNRDRYHEHEQAAVGGGGVGVGGGSGTGIGICSGSSKLHSSSMPRYTHMEEYQRMRPRSYSSTSKPHSERLLPLNKGLLSKINRIAQSQTQSTSQQAQKTDNTTSNMEQGLEAELGHGHGQGHGQLPTLPSMLGLANLELNETAAAAAAVGDFSMETLVPVSDIESLLNTSSKTPQSMPLESPGADYHVHRKKSHHGHLHSSKAHRRRRYYQTPQSMDCGDLYDFLSSSSLSSSSDSEDSDRRHDTDREGDDELTDWPGNELGSGGKYDPKRKLTKKSLLPQIRSDDTFGEDDTLMSGTEASTTAPLQFTEVCAGGASQSPPIQPDALNDLSRFQLTASSEPIEICGGGANRGNRSVGFIDVNICLDTENSLNGMPPLKQIESEMSGETSNPFLSSSPPMQLQEVREIRAGCRRINGDRPGFSIKLSVNERLARFLQDARQTQIRLPDIEIYEHDSLLNLATLYSLNMVVEHGCTVLTKTR